MAHNRAWTDVDPQVPSSFWLVGDDRLDHSIDRQKAGLLRAYMAHSLLYNPKIMISDSNAVNNPNLRHLLQTNKSGVRELINVDTFSVARRANASGGMMSLLELRDEARKTQNLHPGFRDQEFNSDQELRYLEVAADSAKFSLDAVSTHYTESTLALLKSENAAGAFPDDLRKRVLELAENSTRDGAKLLRGFFYGGLEQSVEPGELSRYGDTLHQYGNAFYFSALPNVLEVQPIFPPEYEPEWSILRGFRLEDMASVAAKSMVWDTELTVSAYVEGLNRLEPEDIFALRDPKGDYGAFLDALQKRACNQSESAEEVAIKLRRYEHRIAEKILDRFPEARSTSGDRLQVTASIHDLLERSNLALGGAGLGLLPELGKFIGVNVELVYPGFHIFGLAMGLAGLGLAADAGVRLLRHSAEEQRSDIAARRELEGERLRKFLESSGKTSTLQVSGRAIPRGRGDQIYRHTP